MSKNCAIVSAGGNDGSLFISSMKASKQETSQIKTTFPIFSNQNEGFSLINVEDHEESQVLISDLEQKIRTLKNDHEFALHSKDALWQAEMKELSGKTNEIVEAER
jgi:hypothetical protein